MTNGQYTIQNLRDKGIQLYEAATRSFAVSVFASTNNQSFRRQAEFYGYPAYVFLNRVLQLNSSDTDALEKIKVLSKGLWPNENVSHPYLIGIKSIVQWFKNNPNFKDPYIKEWGLDPVSIGDDVLASSSSTSASPSTDNYAELLVRHAISLEQEAMRISSIPPSIDPFDPSSIMLKPMLNNNQIAYNIYVAYILYQRASQLYPHQNLTNKIREIENGFGLSMPAGQLSIAVAEMRIKGLLNNPPVPPPKKFTDLDIDKIANDAKQWIINAQMEGKIPMPTPNQEPEDILRGNLDQMEEKKRTKAREIAEATAKGDYQKAALLGKDLENLDRSYRELLSLLRRFG